MDTRTQACFCVFIASCLALIGISNLFAVHLAQAASIVTILLCVIQIAVCCFCQLHPKTEAFCYACLVVAAVILAGLLMWLALNSLFGTVLEALLIINRSI